MDPSERTWPYVGYDYSSRVNELSLKIKNAFPDVNFDEVTISAGGGKRPETGLIPENVESYVVLLVGIWNGAVAEVVKKGKPTILVDDLYGGTGEFLSTLSWARNNGYPVVGIASSNFEDALRAISLLRALHELKSSVILDVRDEQTWSERAGAAKALQDFGVRVEFASSEEVNKRYQEISDEEAAPYYEKWMGGALAVKEPAKAEIMKAAKLHVALLKAMQDAGADSVTVDCLGLVYGKKLPAYPCLSFAELDNEGGIGTCEADLDSAFTHLAQKAMAVHSGIAVENVDEEKACRTKLAVKADAKAILANWNKGADFGWHRITVYGDYREDFINFATLFGMKIVEEDTH